MGRRPVIGIIGNAYVVNDEYPVQASGIMNIDAVAHVCGATPLIVPSVASAVDVDGLMSACDGFLFTGGRPNVHPEEYGHVETAAHGTFDRDRDRVTLPLIRACIAAGLPILGVCRGFQEFNVAMGGTLHPEIRELPGRMNHRMPPDGTLEEKFAMRHVISLEAGGQFAGIFGADEVMVNSLHGQGIDEAGPRVHIEGCAPDGTPEAIRITDAPGFALAVQWHPEWKAHEDPVSRPLFESFGEAVAGWRRGDQQVAAQ